MNATVQDPTTIAPPDLWMTMLKSLGMLSLVLGLLIAVLYLARQLFFRKGGMAGNGVIKMLASYHIAPKERIVLMDVLGEKLLIGITPQQIQCLAKIPSDQDIDLVRDNDQSTGSFARFVKEAVDRSLRK